MTQHEPSPPAQEPDDPLAHLHKMSTTAGLGSGDYVAVNGTAVFALILGLTSGLTLLDDLLLVIPLAGIVASIVALRQIAHSNGTQTGKGLVVLALVLCLGFGGYAGSRKYIERARTAADRAAISKLITDFGTNIGAGNTNGAYQLFSSNFQSKISQQTFDERIKLFTQTLGKLNAAGWNGQAEFMSDEATGGQFAHVSVRFDFERATGPIYEDETWFHKDGDTWKIESMPKMLPPPKPPQNPAPGAGPGAGPQ